MLITALYVRKIFFPSWDQTTEVVALRWIETPPDLRVWVLPCFQYLLWQLPSSPWRGVLLLEPKVTQLQREKLALFHGPRLHLASVSHATLAWLRPRVSHTGSGSTFVIGYLLHAHVLWTDSWHCLHVELWTSLQPHPFSATMHTITFHFHVLWPFYVSPLWIKMFVNEEVLEGRCLCSVTGVEPKDWVHETLEGNTWVQ